MELPMKLIEQFQQGSVKEKSNWDELKRTE